MPSGAGEIGSGILLGKLVSLYLLVVGPFCLGFGSLGSLDLPLYLLPKRLDLTGQLGLGRRVQVIIKGDVFINGL